MGEREGGGGGEREIKKGEGGLKARVNSLLKASSAGQTQVNWKGDYDSCSQYSVKPTWLFRMN